MQIIFASKLLLILVSIGPKGLQFGVISKFSPVLWQKLAAYLKLENMKFNRESFSFTLDFSF